MAKPITPLVGCDVFILNESKELLLIKRADNGFWALPGGCNDLGESAVECTIRECFEETGYTINVIELIGVFSSTKYEYINYPWKENEFCHLLFIGEVVSGQATISSETTQVKWFAKDKIPPLSDGHKERINFAWNKLENKSLLPYFE